MKELYSFDVYDTLITRKTATPRGIFALMQKCLLELEAYKDFPDRLRKNFYFIRIQGELVARHTYVRGEKQDLILPRIYDCIGIMEMLTKEQTDALMQLEIKLETENSLPIRENIAKVKKLVDQGKRVVVISDMYLQTETIQEILCSMDDVFRHIPMYVSGDLEKTKKSGILYQYVAQAEVVEFTNWHHFGDNEVADVSVPKRMGIQASCYKTKQLLPWEKEILNKKEDNADLQILIGNSRLVEAASGGNNISYQVGYGFAAQILLPYVVWVLQESLKKGFHKLFFIARDGYILKKIADILIESYSYPIATEYLYGSRRAWRLPSISVDNADIEELIRWSYPERICYYKEIADIFGMSVEELRGIVPAIRNTDIKISRSLVNDLIQLLVKNEKSIMEKVVEKQKEKREAAIQYLQQELDCKNERIAFVDLIGSGYSQRCLGNLIKGFYKGPVETFFYRLDNCKKEEHNINYPFFSNRIQMSNLAEVLCGAPHGQTDGYEKKGKKWVPILGQDEGRKLEAYGYNDYLKGIEEYTKMFCRIYLETSFSFHDLSTIAVYYEYLQDAVDCKLYDYIADMPYGITGKEKKVGTYAPVITDRMLRKLYFTHKGEPIQKYYSGYSLPYSLKRLTSKQQKKLAYYEKHNEDSWIKWLRKHFFAKKVTDSKYALLAEKIVLYGAGKKGQLLYEQLNEKRAKLAKTLGIKVDSVPKVSMWADKEYLKYQKQGLPVVAPKEALKIEYQQVVIAVARKEVATQIEEELVQMGADPGKIIWLNPNEKFL